MSYQRVIPRDFFNEAKLLKCMGLLALKVLDNQLPEGIVISIDESGEPFDIIQMEDSGDLSVVNYPVIVNGVELLFASNYNSKSNFPLYCEIDYSPITVFNEIGDFSNEFIETFTI